MNPRSRGYGSRAKVDALLNPRNVVILGASDRPGNWAQRVWRNLRRYEYPGADLPVQSGARYRLGHALLSQFCGIAGAAGSSGGADSGTCRAAGAGRGGTLRRAQRHRDDVGLR